MKLGACLLAAAMAVLLLAGCGTEEDRVVGTWQGSVDLAGKLPQVKSLPMTVTIVPITCHFLKGKDGKLTGTVETPVGRPGGDTADTVTIKKGAFHMQVNRSNAVYDGRMSQDGKEIAGDLHILGLTLPLTLKKTT